MEHAFQTTDIFMVIRANVQQASMENIALKVTLSFFFVVHLNKNAKR